jgi:hypothetical protein
MCRYGYVKNEQKQSKTDKNEHEIGKRSKTGAREANDQRKLNLSLEVLRDS